MEVSLAATYHSRLGVSREAEKLLFARLKCPYFLRHALNVLPMDLA